MSRLDERDITHLRYLSQTLAARPKEAVRVLEIVRRVAKRPPGDALSEVLAKIAEVLAAGGEPSRARVEQAAKDLVATERQPFLRAGETLEWALKTAGRLASQEDGREAVGPPVDALREDPPFAC
jgi:hypothetical protein